MPVTKDDVYYPKFSDTEIQDCIETANCLTANIVDRDDLHTRDYLERYIDVLLGELAEQAVIQWFVDNGINAKSAVDKKSKQPDQGHDIILFSPKLNKSLKCSVKSSISVQKYNMEDILNTFTVATKKAEIRNINIQVYFWLIVQPPTGEKRFTVPSIRRMAIIGWVGERDILKYTTYTTEKREVPKMRLNSARSMASLIDYIK